MSEFKREDRYIVIKRSDLTITSAKDIEYYIANRPVRTRECVVIEADWPIYEPVWDMVQRMAEGREQRITELEQERDTLAAHVESLKECISDSNEMLGELRKQWQKKMPKSAQDVQDQIDFGENLISRPCAISLARHYPMQPIVTDKHGRQRFEENPIIGHLARDVSDLNRIAVWCAENEVEPKYQEQLAQLIGYSVDGYGTLSYVSDESYERADSLRQQAEGHR